MVELFYEAKFDAAHRLMHHEGKCKNLHGHTWRVSIGVAGNPDPKTGMVVDFAVLKLSAISLVMHYFDHATILNSADRELWMALEKYKLFLIDGEPTCENLARMIFDKIKEKLDCSLFTFVLSSVTVWESETSSARYCGL
jgi:6-pyruvoyltetrahydropterin/6-carboxytetrahydropterin synthase